MIKKLRARWYLRGMLDRAWIHDSISFAMLAASVLPLSVRRQLAFLAAGARFSRSAASRFLARRLIAPWKTRSACDRWRSERVGWARYQRKFGRISDRRPLTSALLIKEPGPGGEKGVLYSAFEFNWMKLVANHDARKFLDEYTLVGASSYSPTDHAVLGNLQGLSDDPIYVGVSHPSDIEQYRLWSPAIEPIPIMASDLTDPDFFKPKPHAERTIDILMVAHFARLKRHWLLFEALSKMRPDLNVVLVGRSAEGRYEQHILEAARIFGVRQQITVHRSLEIEEVAALQCDAKVSIAFSKREGACISVAESLFADSAVAMTRDSHMGSRAYINDATGRFVERRSLARDLSRMVEESGSYRAREWALANISAPRTSARLNAILKAGAERAGRPWTTDIVPLCRRYVPRYLHEADRLRMQSGVKRLRLKHGIVLDEFVSERETSARNARLAAQRTGTS